MRKLFVFMLAALISLPSFGQGYMLAVDATGALGVTNLSKYNVGISVINGYHFSDRFALGLGVGFRYAETLYYDSEDYKIGDHESRDNKYLLPVFLHAKFNFTDGAISPFIVGDVGYTLDVGKNPNKNLEGIFVEPIIGVDFKSAKAIWYLGVGANVQQHHYSHFRVATSNSGESTVKGVAPTIALHFGVQF